MDTERLFSFWLALILLPLAVLLPVMLASFVWKLAGRVFGPWLDAPEESEVKD
jgi:hypothetical protein